MSTEYELSTLCTFSTAHITENDARILSTHDVTGILRTGYGYRVVISEEMFDSEDPVRDQLSLAFIKLMKLALKSSWDYIEIDRDGPVYDNLVKFNW